MTKPLSMDIRDRAMARLDLGPTVQEVADALSMEPLQHREVVLAQAELGKYCAGQGWWACSGKGPRCAGELAVRRSGIGTP